MSCGQPLRIFALSRRKHAIGKARLLLLGIANYNHQLVKAAAYAGLEDQRRLHDSYVFRMLPRDLRHPLLLALNHRRMNNVIQLLHTSAGKGQLCKFCPADASIWLDDFTSETFHHLFIHRLSGTHKLMRNGISLNDVGSKRRKHVGHGGLSASQASRQTNPEAHDASPRRSLAARTVFDINIAMVSGPTPPGTGV